MNAPKALSVSELTALVKNTLEDGFPNILVEGEISNWRPASSGHIYFTLKDRESQLDAVMFRGKAARLAFAPADGALVRAFGNLTVYAARGRYQIVVEAMESSGIGAILQALEERKRRLAAEGLFEEAARLPIPRLPARVGVVTSPTGAAIRDILSTFRRRRAVCDIIVLGAAVQGSGAAAELAERIRYANRHKLVDVLIVGRGGGSLEDLLAFSDEVLVRAVAESRIPVVSAVGHEIDWSLCDYAADLRAATPTAAAEALSLGRDELVDGIEYAKSALREGLEGRLQRARLAVERFRPDSLELQFRRILQPRLQRLDDAKEALLGGLRAGILDARHRIAMAFGTLEASSPEAVLQRGYAVVTRLGQEAPIQDAASLALGDGISIRFARGCATASVQELVP